MTNGDLTMRQGTAMKNNHTSPVTRQGTVITPQLAEALADKAERSYDLIQRTVVTSSRGRPSLSGKYLSSQVTFRLS